MEICNNDHTEIVYEQESKYSPCPLCAAVERIKELEEEVDDLNEEQANHECK